MAVKPTLQLVYRLLQVALLIVFLATLALSHLRNNQRADNERKTRLLDELFADVTRQQNEADELLAKAQKTLAEAQKWKPEVAPE